MKVLKKFSQELKKNNVEKDLNNIGDYLSKHHKELFDLIKEMLAKITDDRNLIYQEIVQEKLTQIEVELATVKQSIANKIQQEFNGNSFLFWSNQVANQIFESHGIHQYDFIKYLSEKVYEIMSIIFPQIDKDLSNFNKVQIVIDMFKDKTKNDTFTLYLRDYKNEHGISEEFTKQLQEAPKLDGVPMPTRKDLFNQYLNQTLRQYYQNIIKD